jgi:predicted metal-dependent phosphoesterase TrpH
VNISTTGLELAPDAPIDLQLHTHYSDGRWTPEQLMNYLVSEGFGLAAITDHDRVDTAAVLQRLALDRGLPLLVAAEMTTTWNGAMTDLLCYGFDPENNALQALAADVLRRQQDNTREIYEALRRAGYAFAQQSDDLLPILDVPSAQQPHELVAFVRRHIDAADMAAVGEILRGLEFATSTPEAVVDAAHRSGAVVLVAHPGRDDGFVPFDGVRLDQLRREVPVDGLEVYYPAHTPEQTALFADYAQKNGLLTSSGSDSHSADKKPVKYPAALSRNLLEHLGIQVK